MTGPVPDILRWRLSQSSSDALTRLVGAPLGMVGRADAFRPAAAAASFHDLGLYNLKPQYGRRAAISTIWHTDRSGMDWHEIVVTDADAAAVSAQDHALVDLPFSPLERIEAVTLNMAADGQGNAPELSVDFAINFVLANGDAIHLTTDIDSIIGTVVVSNGRFDAVALEWEGLTHAVRPLLN